MELSKADIPEIAGPRKSYMAVSSIDLNDKESDKISLCSISSLNKNDN